MMDESAEAALALYSAGLHVFPLPRGKKTPYGPHSVLNTTRLHRPWIAEACSGSNLAVKAGRLSGNLVVFDCDTTEDFESLGREFAARAIRVWIRNSARPGKCGQYWLRVEEGEVANTNLSPADSAMVKVKLEVLGNNLHSLAPPSIHPSGFVYEWLARDSPEPPAVPLAALAFLGPQLQLASQRRRRAQKGEKKSALPPVADKVLIQRDAQGYASNSEAEYAACASLVMVGWTDQAILKLFKQFPAPHYTKVGDRAFAKHVLAKARIWAETNPGILQQSNNPQQPYSDVYVVWANSRPWPGRTGSVDRAVFLALVNRLRMQAGIMPIRGSIREIAELASVSRDTAHTALGRLEKQGFVVAHTHRGTQATDYTLTVDLEAEALTASVASAPPTMGGGVRRDSRPLQGCRLTPNVLVDATPLASHDAWLPSALGKPAWHVWTVLLDYPGQSGASLARHTGRCRTSVKGGLDKLATNGLAIQQEGLWKAVETTLEALDEIARAYGTLGRAKARKMQHADERARWATNLVMEQKWRYDRNQETKAKRENKQHLVTDTTTQGADTRHSPAGVRKFETGGKFMPGNTDSNDIRRSKASYDGKLLRNYADYAAYRDSQGLTTKDFVTIWNPRAFVEDLKRSLNA